MIRHQMRRARRINQKGFTLIELLLVIVILGVLSGIVVFAVGGISDRGEESACKSDKKTVEVAQEAYRANNSAYAGSVATLISAKLLRAPAPAGITTDTSGTVYVTGRPCT